MADLTKGWVIVTNWHVFEPQSVQTGGIGGKVIKAGVRVVRRETVVIGSKTTTARGKRYLTPAALASLEAAGRLRVIDRTHEAEGKVEIEAEAYVESDAAVVNRVIGKEVGGKQNILIFNDEAHHAYRIRQPENGDEEDDGDESEDFYKEATVWIDGLDRVHKQRGINFCVDLSATPLLPRTRWSRDKPHFPVGRLGFRIDRRDRVRPDEDPATRRPRHNRPTSAELLQYLALAAQTDDQRGTRRPPC
jgi:type III restriction enzyme